jgi:hypothetical protein
MIGNKTKYPHNPNNPSYPTTYKGFKWYFPSNFYSKTKKNPLNTNEQIIRIYPIICRP